MLFLSISGHLLYLYYIIDTILVKARYTKINLVLREFALRISVDTEGIALAELFLGFSVEDIAVNSFWNCQKKDEITDAIDHILA